MLDWNDSRITLVEVLVVTLGILGTLFMVGLVAWVYYRRQERKEK